VNWKVINIKKELYPSTMRCQGKDLTAYIATVSNGKREHNAFGLTEDIAKDRALRHVSGDRSLMVEKIILPVKTKRQYAKKPLSGRLLQVLNILKSVKCVTAFEIAQILDISVNEASTSISGLRSKGFKIINLPKIRANNYLYIVYELVRE